MRLVAPILGSANLHCVLQRREGGAGCIYELSCLRMSTLGFPFGYS